MYVKTVIINMNTLELNTNELKDVEEFEENYQNEGLAGLNGSGIYIDDEIAKAIMITPNYLIISFKSTSGYKESHWVIPKERIGRLDIRGNGDLLIEMHKDDADGVFY